jgi:hypothetical protein
LSRPEEGDKGRRVQDQSSSFQNGCSGGAITVADAAIDALAEVAPMISPNKVTGLTAHDVLRHR